MYYKNKYHREWVRKFTCLPKRIDDITVWFDYYWSKYSKRDVKICTKCKNFDNCHIVGWWTETTDEPNQYTDTTCPSFLVIDEN